MSTSSANLIAHRYARSLYLDAASSAQKLKVVHSDVLYLLELADDNDAFRMLLSFTFIPSQRKQRAWQAIAKKGFDELTSHFVETLILRKRENYLAKICRAFIILYNQAHSIEEVEIVSAVSLAKKQLDALSKKISTASRHINIQSIIDPSLIGGVVIKNANKVLDLSVRGRLQKIRKELLN